MLGGIAAATAAIYLLPEGIGELSTLRGELRDQAQTVEQVRNRVEGLATSPAGGQDLAARVQTLEDTRAGIKERVAALESAAGSLPKSDEVAAQLNAADNRLAALEDKVGALAAGAPGAGGGQRLTALQNDLAQLTSTVAQLQRGGGAGQTSPEITELAGKVAALSGQIASNQDQAKAARADVATLTGQVQLLDEHAKTLTSDVQGLQDRVAANEAQITAAGDQRGRAATLALLAGQIEAAIDQAAGYEAPLESLRALGADDPAVKEAVAQLAPAAASGVSSLTALRQSFEPTANQIVHAAAAPGGEGVLDRAANSLMRLVTVRPVGADAEGDDAPARVARAEAKLMAGDLAGAVAELDGLEGPAAEAAAPWLAQAKARLAAETALDRLRTHTTGLLAQAH